MAAESAAPVNNEAEHQWEVTVGAHTAIIAYRRSGDRIVYLHTEVPRALEGHGIASALARAALDDARARRQSVVPSCRFVASFIKRHPEYQDLVHET